MRPNTKLLFAETPTNPLTEVCDIQALADMAHNAGALLAVDNCFASPALQKPLSMGADLIMHSGTKYLDGQGRVVAGALCGSEKLITEKLLPILKSGGMTLVCLQCLGCAQRHGNVGYPHGSAISARIGFGSLAGVAPQR